MNLYIKRIIKTVLWVSVIAGILAYEYKVRHQLPSWEQVLTTKFWILSIIHLIPAYFIVREFENNSLGLSESRVVFIIICLIWSIVFGIACAICHFVFHYDIL